jgi:transcriptional regulator with XRE-family HTH domain
VNCLRALACDTSAMPNPHPPRPHLREWRLHLGHSLKWLADKLATSHPTVIRWERGESGVNDATFEAIARAYGITPAELSAPPSEAERARILHQLLQAIPNLTDKKLAALAGMAESLKGD